MKPATTENTLLKNWACWIPPPSRFSVWSCWCYAWRTFRVDAEIFWGICRRRLAVISTVCHLLGLLLSNTFHFFFFSFKRKVLMTPFYSCFFYFKSVWCSEAMVHVTQHTKCQNHNSKSEKWFVLLICFMDPGGCLQPDEGEVNRLLLLPHAGFVCVLFMNREL